MVDTDLVWVGAELSASDRVSTFLRMISKDLHVVTGTIGGVGRSVDCRLQVQASSIVRIFFNAVDRNSDIGHHFV